MAEQHSNCGNCIYFRDQQIMGVCRLFPQQVNKHNSDWCGQHKVAREMLELPVVEMTAEAPKRKYTRKAKVEE